MSLIQLPSAGFTPTLWRNGLGRSWEIASDPQGAGPADDFRWRFALAEISVDAAFSFYAATDRVFTLIEGRGLTLDFADGHSLEVAQPHQPVAFPGDVATHCRLHDGPCRVLNLLVARGVLSPVVTVQRLTAPQDLPPLSASALAFALAGDLRLDDQVIRAGGAALLDPGISHAAPLQGTATLYLAELR